MGMVMKLGMQLSLPKEWVDSSDDAGNSDCLLTLTRPDGVGAFQISFAQYVSGRLPNIKLDDLRDLLSKFAAIRRLGPEQGSAVGGHDVVIWCRTDYHQDDDFVRVWYISNSKSVILATYVCNWQYKDIEIRDCDLIVESVKFIDS
jgi:hypothetical protein